MVRSLSTQGHEVPYAHTGTMRTEALSDKHLAVTVQYQGGNTDLGAVGSCTSTGSHRLYCLRRWCSRHSSRWHVDVHLTGRLSVWLAVRRIHLALSEDDRFGYSYKSDEGNAVQVVPFQ